MSRQHYQLPPLSALATFETAARCESFKRAAAELNVTPGAVSHQIKALEEEIGVELFHRKYRGVSLTENGYLLFLALQRGFADISLAVGQLRKSIDRNSVTVAATTAMSSLWLTPRLSEFWKENGDISVNQIVSDTGVNHGEVPDLKIQFGSSADEDIQQDILFRDNVIAVTSPERVASFGKVSLEKMAKASLIHLDAKDKRWVTWQGWFTNMGYNGTIAQGLRVNNYAIALQAAQDGAGLVLGWKHLIQPLLDEGRLVQIGTHTMSSPHRFFVLSDPPNLLSPSAKILKNWLLENI